MLSKENINKLTKINKMFADIYLKNLTVIEILVYSEEHFIEKLYEDYIIFNDLNKTQFVNLIKNFTKEASDNIYNMFNTIKLLLLGTEENCAIASLLFNLLKDKKVSNGNEIIANIIYSHLNYIAQLKLKKSSFNIKNELEKLKGITNADIDLKKHTGKTFSPFIIFIQNGEQTNSFPIPKKISSDLPNNHLKYSLTWFSIAISILLIYLYFRKKNY